MNTFDILTSEALLESTNAKREITTSIQNQNNENYDGLIELQCKTKVIEHERQTRKALHDQASTYKKLNNSSKIQDSIDEVRQLETTSMPEMNMKLDAIKKDLQSALNSKNSQIGELNKFREDHKLTKASVYPSNQNKLIGVLVFMGVLEAGLNAFFLSKASEFGLAGGFAMAAGISALNILLAFFMSTCIRNAHYNDSKKSMMGFTFAAIIAVAVSTLALFIGHYRAALDENLELASFQAVKNMADAPLGISTFDSWILVCITFAIFMLVTWKFFKNDDPYPGYGEISRKTDAEIAKYSRYKTKADALVKQMRVELIQKFEQKYEALNQLSHSLEQDGESIEQLERDYQSFLSQQALEYEAYCELCRQRFSHDVNQILDKTAVFSKEKEKIEFQELTPLLKNEDIERFREIKAQIRSFRETDFSQVRASIIASANKITLNEGAQ
ncbi:MAG: hypothetical protein ABJK37_22700 [Paraglaciecola sp.]|uniref:hypothetical protein n=1 Tax=Paraglaciecola sp. TaxID=1920173 RepID=UPI0032981648